MRGRKVFIAQLFLKYILWAKLTLQCGYNSRHHGVYNLVNEIDENNELNNIYPKIHGHQDVILFEMSVFTDMRIVMHLEMKSFKMSS